MPTCWVMTGRHQLVILSRLINDSCDTCNEHAGFSQSAGNEHPWAKSSQSRDNSNKQKLLKLSGFLEIQDLPDSHKKLKINEYTCSFLTFLANQDLKPQFKQAKMEIPPINLTISRVAPFHHMPWWVKFGKWQAHGYIHRDGWLSWKHGHIRYRWCIELTTMIP